MTHMYSYSFSFFSNIFNLDEFLIYFKNKVIYITEFSYKVTFNYIIKNFHLNNALLFVSE